MGYRICVLGSDPRQQWIAHYLAEDHCVFTFGVPNTKDSSADLSALLSSAQAVVLPFPATKEGLVQLTENRSVSPELICRQLPEQAHIFGGLLPDLDYGKRQVHDYGQDESITVYNAAITAEGAIFTAMQASPDTLWRSRCLVIGYGRIGKALAPRLRALGATVTISARHAADLAAIDACGYHADHTGAYETDLGRYHYIFNKVPALILNKHQISRTAPDCLLIDLASMPGGMDFEACRQLGRHCIHALSLPGKTAPATAGKILADYIVQHLSERVIQ